jgi:hypothetical protein
MKGVNITHGIGRGALASGQIEEGGREEFMNENLRAALPHLMPKAIAWAEQIAGDISRAGAPLDDYRISIARRVGVVHPELVRIGLVEQLPLPSDPELRQAAITTGLLGPNMIGLTLGHSICICRPHNSIRLLSHECRHVHQYEVAGSIAAFLPTYLQQIVDFGYANAPFEVDARRHEIPA